MKKLSCLFNHRYKKIKDLSVENFENEDKEIKTFTCKDCGKEITFIVTCVKAKFCKPFENNILKNNIKED